MRSSIASALAWGSVLLSGVHAIQSVSRAGRYLYTADGNRFYIKGIAYQEQGAVSSDPNSPFLEPSTYIDPLSFVCTASTRLLTTTHACSCSVVLESFRSIDLALPVNGSINRASPAWTTALQDQYLETIQAFSKYDNVLAYNVGNEVVTAPNETVAATFVKAATRDVKAYLNTIKSSVLVGYAAINGDPSWILPLAEYLSCDPSGGNSGSIAIDLYGLNNYQWCGTSTFQASYAGTEALYSAYNVPAYFSEFGCPTDPVTDWSEVGALLSSNMSPVWSGGVAFSYFPATASDGDYGIVSISSDGSTVTVNGNFNNLKTQYTEASPPKTPSQSAAGSTSYPSCPQQNSTMLASTTLPPTPNLAACNCLENNLSCQFTPTTSNYSAILGSLLDYGCSLLGQSGGTCAPISANGTSGVYGAVSACDPSVMLSWVMTQYYLDNNNNLQSCSFGGNGTINSHAPSSTGAANAAASSCLASATGTSVPTLPAGGTSSSGGGSSGGGSGSSSGNGTAGLDAKALVSVIMFVVVGVVSGMWSLS